MIKLFDITHHDEWDSIVRSFPNHDIYYLSGYVRAFQIHNDGIPYLMYYEGDELRAIYVYMKRITAIEGVYDSITPYGYGGILFNGNVDSDNATIFWKEYLTIMKQERIVDNFVRYHPILANASNIRIFSNVLDLGKTIAMDLSSPDVIWGNLSSKNRNKIRKAEKNGIEIKHGKGLSILKEFKEIYDGTMLNDNAEDYYFFNESFYESIDKDLHENYEVFWAEYEGQKIAMSIMLFANNRLNYHLSGSVYKYRNLAPTNLLLYKAALWGYEQGMKTFHLGGGLGSHEDDLYKFKASFNRNSNYQFSIGKEIYDHELYDELVHLRESSNPNFDKESKFFPLYRA